MSEQEWMQIIETDGFKHIFVKTRRGVIASIKLFGLKKLTSNNCLVIKSGFADIIHFDLDRHESENFFFMLENPKVFQISKILEKFGSGNVAYLCLYLVNDRQMQNIIITVAERDMVMYEAENSNVWYPLEEFTLVNIGDGFDNNPIWSII